MQCGNARLLSGDGSGHVNELNLAQQFRNNVLLMRKSNHALHALVVALSIASPSCQRVSWHHYLIKRTALKLRKQQKLPSTYQELI